MARVMKDSGVEWIGDIPETWSCGKCKIILISNDGGVWGDDPVGDDSDKVVIRSTEQTIDGKWCIENPATRDLRTIDYRKARIQKDDLLITKSSGSDLHIGKTTIADDYFDNHECYYSNFIQRIRCGNYLPKLLWYLFNSSIVRQQCVFLQNTTSGIGNINAQIINNLYVPIPPNDEQVRITNFLDSECSHIDSVIEQTRASIEEYKKLKQAIITQAVTKGIRPERRMKNSQSVWFGSIPAEWEMRKIKYLFTIKKDIAGEEGYAVLSITQRGILPKDLSKNEGQLAENYSHYQLVNIGDFAMNHMDLLTGWVDISSYNGVTSPDYRVFVLDDKTKCSSRYYLYLMQMCYFNRIFYGLGQGVSGMGRWRLQADKFLNFFVTVPPYEEQEEIADYIDDKCMALDNLIKQKDLLLADLEAYKKSLIYECVTGKKEVPACQ